MSQRWPNKSRPFDRRLFCIVGWVRKSQRTPRLTVKRGRILHWSDANTDQLARLKLTSPTSGNSPEPPVGRPSSAPANDNPPVLLLLSPGQGVVLEAPGQLVIPDPKPKVWKVLIWSRATQTYWPPNLKSWLPLIQSRLELALQSGLRRRESPRFPTSTLVHGALSKVATIPLNCLTFNPNCVMGAMPAVLSA